MSGMRDAILDHVSAMLAGTFSKDLVKKVPEGVVVLFPGGEHYLVRVDRIVFKVKGDGSG